MDKHKQYIKYDYKTGYKEYYKDPEMTIRHREDGPAVIDQQGAAWWYLNGEPVLNEYGEPKFREANFN